ncbi:MAG: restriction endonuclease [Clostridium sp.]|nr:restriction endonuclease [Clostridium sp.]
MAKKKSELADVPDIRSLINPTFKALKFLGGVATNSEICDKVISIMNLSSEITEVPHIRNNQTELEYRLAWARTALKKAKVINNISNRTWSITSKYISFSDLTDDVIELAMSLKQVPYSSIENADTVAIDTDIVNDYIMSAPDAAPWREQVREALVNMDPYKFESLCAHILRKCGLVNIELTSKSRDHGIDGTCRLSIDEPQIFSDLIAFQCKKYKSSKSITSQAIQAFRGSLPININRGLFITTSYFTKEAREAASSKDQNKEINLIDGDKLIDLILQYEIGVSKEIVYTVDKKYFENYE